MTIRYASDGEADFRKIRSHAVRAVFGFVFLGLGVLLMVLAFYVLGLKKPEAKVNAFAAFTLGGLSFVGALGMLAWTWSAWRSERIRADQLALLNSRFDEIVDRLEEFEKQKENPLPYLLGMGITDARLLAYILKYRKGQPRTLGFGAPEF